MKHGKWNNPLLGYIGGLALPLLALVVIYLAVYAGHSFSAFVKILWFQGNASKVLSLALVPNLVLFFIFIWTNRLKSAQGVLGTTIALALIIIFLRFLL
ncbi:MAG: hypothetical protein AB7S54_09145 [Bacteroidales bacterium]